jgi:hypothetical protein
LKAYRETKRNPGPNVAYTNVSDDEIRRWMAAFPKVDKAKKLENEPVSLYIHGDNKCSVLIPL